MKYLPMMTEDEIRYVCSVLPLRESVLYFKRYPKDFGKVMPGFRATSLKSQEQVSGVLFRSRNQHFISSFIEKHIIQWIDDIGTSISEEMAAGASKESAWLQVLPHCFFVDKIGLYFKLTGEEHSEEFIAILGASIKLTKDSEKERKRMEVVLKDKSSEVRRVEAEFERVQSEYNETRKKLSERIGEIEVLKRTSAGLENLKETIQSLEQAIERLKQKAQEREVYIQGLKGELLSARDEQHHLKEKIRESIEKQRAKEYIEQEVFRKPRCPKDIDEFKDYLGYNLQDLGVPTDADYYVLLKDYLGEVLFQGKPVIVSRNTGMSLMKCVSNTLINTTDVPTLVFASDITERAIDSFLSRSKRIVCLDNFIGNYNETTLITISDRHKDKVIFLTVAYDRTLRYVPNELMKYCHYLNLNRIEEFTANKELSEDPSIVDETEVSNDIFTPDSRWSQLLRELLDEFGIRGALSAYKSARVSDEMSLSRLLAFDVLPYCVDVLQIAPFNTSERLVKYAGDGGRCSHKDLFKRWFA
ncbi:hypothetical protein [Ferroacidibacillus organovorans]|uniref:Uncharacterized protein n=1 Tax=Ferroacidibacillus organovorans TaxID=1765683 RepID=A0A853KFL3_9BACL|nr:hypothetical protein [Ferroacidibacillus organovorans]KYP81651.1 hypothetical protein AYJ22_06390 [Ferroacidibacillus organovorans]OAG94150.1 hypothetical protein AYW79_06930 [Ferroacidibacillus organovorans]